MITLGLLALAAALAAYLLVSGNDEQEEKAETAQKRSSAIIPEGARPVRVTLIRSSGTIIFEAVPDTPLWRITEPVEAYTEPVYMTILLNDFIRLKKLRLICIRFV